MLTATQFDSLSVPITDLYEQYNQTVINDIARRLSKMGNMTETAAWQMQRLIESGKIYENALDELSKLTGQSKETLKTLFQEAGVKSLAFDDRIYKAAGLNPLAINLSPAMQNVLLAGLEKTDGMVSNLVKTTAIDAERIFTNATDLAYMQVTNGAMSYDQAIRAAVKDMARQGISTIDYRGRRDQLDVATRRAVLTGVAQTTGTLSNRRAEEMGCDLVQTSAHIGARPEHEEWQGQVFSRSGKSDKYPDFVGATDYGSATGLCGINCRHSFYPFFEGLSENAYTQETLNEYADKTVEYNGEKMSVYEGTQMQRGMEREIRRSKREAEALGAAKLPNIEEVRRVKAMQMTLRDFVSQTGLDRQSSREGARVAKMVAVPKISAPIVPPVYKMFGVHQITQEEILHGTTFEGVPVGVQMNNFGKSFADVETLSAKERFSSLSYKADSNPINNYLRTGTLSPGYGLESSLESRVKDIESAMQKSVVSENVMVYRGLNKLTIGPDTGSYVGTIFTDKAFVSTSLSERSALGWSWVNQDQVGTVVAIKLDAGSHALYLDALNDRGEYELLLPKNTRFRVISDELTSRYGTDEPWRLITVEIIK